ncbi:nucleic acid-binding protein [Bacillus idriensis]|uniref:Nucleic acid-binding protein n=1 Tax=Metabacillus idriensis TaxID=324768 RepID=A0A6I2M8X3_9BACI|nr:nucleic acid-binding protein [Metabacillus idriensis]
MINVNFEKFVCASCGKSSVRERVVCPACKSTEFNQQQTEGIGKVYSFTKIHISSEEFKHLTPYYIVVVDLASGDRVTGRIKEDVNINNSVILTSFKDGVYTFNL